MLSGDILSQLSELKKDIRASRDVAQGTVRGTSGRFGFVTLDDGRDAFLPPDQMDRVFHGDRVEVLITSETKDEGKTQYQAKLEKLIHSPQKQIAGRYCIKGKGHFVIVEHQQHSRWIFVPPKARAKAQDGHCVSARIIQHPFETGKAQAKVMEDIGTEINANSARQFTLAQHQLFDQFSKECLEQAKAIQAQASFSTNARADLRDVAFITIDSASTRDMDDALSINKTDNGWLLQVAIADPSSEIDWESPIDQIALRRGQSLYLPGKPVPMLPDTLSTDRYSLLSGTDRPALVVRLSVASSGEVTDYEFLSAQIRSHAKLSYQQVSAFLAGEDFSPAEQLDDAQPFAEALSMLKACSDALLTYRNEHELVGDYRPDYMLILNNDGKLDRIERLEKTPAHQIVEEAMLATNSCAGDFLSKHQAGLFVVQPGYRDERRDDIEVLLKEALGEDNLGDTRQLGDYLQLIKNLRQHENGAQLLAKQQRFQQASEPSLTAAAHFGLGKAAYATITSPIRRYQDLYNHRVIHAILNKQKPVKLRGKLVERLKETLSSNRGASRTMEQWLIADYLQAHIGERFEASIALLTNQGIGVRLLATGIEGFIAGVREDKENPEAEHDKISFNNQRLELTWNNTPLALEQIIEVELSSVDMDKKKPIFSWVKRPE